MPGKTTGFPGHPRGHITTGEWQAVARTWANDPAYLAYLRRIHGAGDHERTCQPCQQRITATRGRADAQH
jgi:hypothetical protein